MAPQVLLVQTDSKQLKEVQPTQRIERMLQTFHWKLLGSFSFFLYKIFICCNFQGRSVLIGVFASGRAEGGGHPLDKGGAKKTYLKTLINFFCFLTQDVPLDSLDSEPLIFVSQSIF